MGPFSLFHAVPVGATGNYFIITVMRDAVVFPLSLFIITPEPAAGEESVNAVLFPQAISFSVLQGSDPCFTFDIESILCGQGA
jgi:hypothetical protein